MVLDNVFTRTYEKESGSEAEVIIPFRRNSTLDFFNFARMKKQLGEFAYYLSMYAILSNNSTLSRKTLKKELFTSCVPGRF